ncbi:MAG TPA: M36 family metallopeptidase, partial [Herpetosiphonaceae bacterium]
GPDPRLAWHVSLYELSAAHHWSVRVDAASGAILGQNDWVIHDEFDAAPPAHPGEPAAQAPPADLPVPLAPNPVPDGSSYRGYPLGVESPQHTAPLPPADGRALVNQPADAVGSPFGWHDTDGAAGAEFTTTQGNNVHAYIDADDNDQPDAGGSPSGGAGLDFSFPLNLSQAPSAYRPAATTNLFLWNNYLHDTLYRYGFTEAAGGFQANNYGRGGLANDPVQAEAQDGGGLNNANFYTPPDGQQPRMQMYLWSLSNPQRDGDFDNGIIAHEYGHGISNRLTGGPSNTNCLWNGEQMGEGWSDWQGLFLTQKAGDTGPQRRGVGTYALNQPVTGEGVRDYPYSTNMAINPQTYNSIRGAWGPHSVGQVWAAMLWEINWALIGKYGFSGDFYRPVGGSWTALKGNQLAQQLITDGMKLQPCSPGFVDGRDAILAADQAYTGGANTCLLWTAFAKRGLGFGAVQGSSASVSDNAEAFEMPPACKTIAATPPAQTICRGANAAFTVLVGSQNVAPVTLSASGVPAGATAAFSQNPIAALPGSSGLTIGNTAAAAAGAYRMTVAAAGAGTNYSIPLSLTIVAAPPEAPGLRLPHHRSTNVDLLPALSWAALPGATAYELEVATDAAFANLVYTATTALPGATLDTRLDADTLYYWRAKAGNVCGFGASSAASVFRTKPAQAVCPVNSATVTVYSTDFERSTAGWTHGGTNDTWALASYQTTSGIWAWHADDPGAVSDQQLVSPRFNLPSALHGPVSLRFQNLQLLDGIPVADLCWDGGLLEVATDGATWIPVPKAALLTDPYDARLLANGSNPLRPAEVWCDPGYQPRWINSVVDISAYAGQSVQFRWRLASDEIVGREGWYIDDVSVQGCAALPHNVTVAGDQEQLATKGLTATYALEVTNNGAEDDTFAVSVSGNAWATVPATTSLRLASGERALLEVAVLVPASAADGASDSVTVEAVSQAGPATRASALLITRAVTQRFNQHFPSLRMNR